MQKSDLGKKFILGFHGTKIPAWVHEFSALYGLGGVILFDYRVETKSYENNIQSPGQLKSLITEIKSLPSSPKIFIDQEGGKVRRLKESRGFKPLMSHLEYAKAEPAERRAQIKEAFCEMKNLGIDVVLGPVIDINYNSESPDIGIYQRSFSESLEIVTECASEWFELAREHEIELCLKHFPGLGAAKQNSHKKLTQLSDCFFEEQEQLFYDLLPKVPGSHILFSHGIMDIWGDGLPISVNRTAYEKIRSVFAEASIITDDMQMRGLLDLMPLRRACQMALKNGASFICIGNNLINQEHDMIPMARSLLG